MEGTTRVSYKNMVIGRNGRTLVEERETWDDYEISNDDLVEEGDGAIWFEMRMTREEKIAT